MFNGMDIQDADLLTAMLETAATGFCLVSGDSRVLAFNSAAGKLYRQVTGRELEEGLLLLSVFTPDRATVVRNALDTALQGRITEYEVRYDTPAYAGWVKVRYSPAYGPGGHSMGVCIINEDITARKTAEEQSQRREKKFLSLFHFSSIGMAVVDPDGALLDANPSLSAMLGYSREELLQRSIRDFTHPADLGLDIEHVNRLLAGEIETYQIEKRYYHKDGHIVWGLLTCSVVRGVDGVPGCLIGQVVDITMAKEMVKELEDRNTALDFTTANLEQQV